MSVVSSGIAGIARHSDDLNAVMCTSITKVIFVVVSVLVFVTHPSEASAQNATPLRLDLHGDELPNGVMTRLGTVRFRNGGPVSSLAFLPDGKSIISIGPDAVRLRNVESGLVTRSWQAIRSTIGAIAVAPNGRYAYASDRNCC